MLIQCDNYGHIYEDGFQCTFKENSKHDRLSSEKLCFNCEVRKFPERFHACAFCKRPLKYKLCCIVCTDGFNEWIKSQIHPIDPKSILIRKIAKNLLNIPYKTIEGLDNKHFIVRTKDSFFKWPGFYAGLINNSNYSNQINETTQYMPRWIIPNLTIPYNVSYNIKLNFKFYESLLLDILKTNHIDLYSYVQIDMTQLEIDQISIINSHDTRYIRSLE
jgi:hypothetical protein